jgi:regulator of chromosome condensation
MNDLPRPASHPRPARQLFVCGSGDNGQLGFGTTATYDHRKPRLHVGFELQMKTGMLGIGPHAGIERACAGGMHSLVIDENGGVSDWAFSFILQACIYHSRFANFKVWSWGVNDDAALGRQTDEVPDPDEPSQVIDPFILEAQPMIVPVLAKTRFRTVQVAAGDSVSVFLNSEGEIYACGRFRVCFCLAHVLAVFI